MISSSLLALVFTVSCFTPSTEVPSLPNETYVYPAAVFNGTQQICSQENLRQGIINGIKQDSYRYIQNILSKYSHVVHMNCMMLLYCRTLLSARSKSQELNYIGERIHEVLHDNSMLLLQCTEF